MRIYEITDKNYAKYYIRGLKSDLDAVSLGKGVLGKYFFDISYYDNEPSKYHEKGYWTKKSMTKSQFLKYKWRYN
jgi:hypothetical protein